MRIRIRIEGLPKCGSNADPDPDLDETLSVSHNIEIIFETSKQYLNSSGLAVTPKPHKL